MSEQIAIPDDLAASLQELVDVGVFGNTTEAVRAAIIALVETERRSRVGALIADGYRRISQTDEEVRSAMEAATRSIHGEPW